ncbi:TIGR02444 family protein [Photobacterium satsumensis]|uniref:TIGR02444 family protein n=1 Tax=Photobacterium satsumensis TaxID=2910239 RepID=UPI003D13E006
MPQSDELKHNDSSQAPLSHDAFWQFSYSHYFKADVEAACLALQTFHRGSVNLALLMIWLDAQAIDLTQQQRQQLELSLQPTEGLLERYRHMRRSLKPQLDTTGYEQLKDFELQMERQQQHDLIATLNQLPLRHVADNEDAANLARYCHRLGAVALIDKLMAK